MLTERYKDEIAGVISCYDRVVIRGTLPGWCVNTEMTKFLNWIGVRIFDFPLFGKALNDEIRENAKRVAEENGIKIEFIRKLKAFRKETRIKEILKERGEHPGIVHIFSAMETCVCYRRWYDKKTKRAFLLFDSGKCLHYYFYFIDKEFGLCYLRVPTWCPFTLQFYFNGHNWLKKKLDKKNIAYEMQENAFLFIDDFEKAQEISDKFRVEDLHKALDLFADKYCPIIKKYDLKYRWSIMQAEYATDIVFKKQASLKDLYDPLIRTAIHSVKPDNIATFLGRRLDTRYQGEAGNNFNIRIRGTRIKHQMDALAIKMYDKFGIILRIETTVNNVSRFRHYREVQKRDGTIVKKNAQMKKNIYSLFPLSRILKSSNRRYLEFISGFDDMSKGLKNLKKISKTVKSKARVYKGFNFYSEEDQRLFETLARGEFNIYGLQNKMLRQYFPSLSSGAISRILKRLRSHGLIRKIGKSYKYYLTKLGKAVIAAGLAVKEMLVIPKLSAFANAGC